MACSGKQVAIRTFGLAHVADSAVIEPKVVRPIALRAGSLYVEPANEEHWQEKARAALIRQRTAIAMLGPCDLRQMMQREKTLETERQAEISMPVPAKASAWGGDLKRKVSTIASRDTWLDVRRMEAYI